MQPEPMLSARSDSTHQPGWHCVCCCAEYREGDTIAILPGEDPAAASEHADIVICTGLGSYRNGIVGRSDAVIAVGGGAGTLQVRQVGEGVRGQQAARGSHHTQ